MHINLIYISIFALFCAGILGVLISKDEIKKLIFLGFMQSAIIMLYVSAGYKKNNFIAPVYIEGITNYINPVPHVLMLTAIVVGIAVSAVGLSMIIQIKKFK